MPPCTTNELLLTLAELSIAYVGFAAVVGVISQRAAAWPLELRLMFRAMIEVGLFSVLICILPVALATTGLTDQALWFMSSIVALACGGALFSARVFLLRTRLPGVPAISRVLLIPVSLIAMLINVANILIWREAAPYVAGALLPMGSGAVIFLTMIYTLFPLRANDENP